MIGRTQLDYWCHTDLSLESLFARFSAGFITRDVEIDAENVWCWAEGTMEDNQTSFNISRKHYIGVEPELPHLPVEPVSIRFTRVHSSVKELELGQKLADVLQLEIFLGNMHYVGGDDFLFLAQHSFQPFSHHPST
ncbi:MAG: hypothetical protein HY774_14655 [Acidobacteria bacterium]|nr:hypothetical protein [Acidobacteriota bacterium]